ncbi:MAG TPA: glucan 1,4-alpha-glucosidase, partial [Thermoplasmata archaeon]|nr:glucan 1,4-alpha-glucosidase [Thermoplasmata archaeon]
CWRRYNHDGYGQRDDGGPYDGWGVGRPWPLLTGERGHYEIAAGRSGAACLDTMARFATETGLLPEQVWDGPDRPDLHLTLGKPTGSAMPLAWAHAEFLKLQRSVEDGAVFDRIPTVEHRYARPHPVRTGWEVWKPSRRPTTFAASDRVRVLAPEPFRLHWSRDGWTHVEDTEARATGIDLHYVDLPADTPPGTEFVFTFFWTDRPGWEGANYTVVAQEPARPSATGPVRHR